MIKVERIKKVVNLDSYTSSPYWLGFIALSKGSRQQAASLLIDHVLRHERFFKNGQLLSNLHTFKSETEFTRAYNVNHKDFELHIYPLFERKLIKSVEDYTDVPELTLRSAVKEKVYRHLSFAMMNIDGVYGHCFFTMSKMDCCCIPMRM